MKLYSIYSEEEVPEIEYEGLIYTRCSEQVEVAKTIDRKITLVRVENKGEVIEMAFRSFAGITEDEEDVAVHLYQMESYEDVARTIRLYKLDNSIEAEEYYIARGGYSAPNEESCRLMFEEWELQYGCELLKKAR